MQIQCLQHKQVRPGCHRWTLGFGVFRVFWFIIQGRLSRVPHYRHHWALLYKAHDGMTVNSLGEPP